MLFLLFATTNYIVVLVKQSLTPIPVPSTLKRSSLERSTTPAGRAMITPTRKEPSPQVAAKNIPPPNHSTFQKSETPVEPSTKGMFNSTQSGPLHDIQSSSALSFILSIVVLVTFTVSLSAQLTFR
jgi:hypothetical protein